jgi:hypothetical protein
MKVLSFSVNLLLTARFISSQNIDKVPFQKFINDYFAARSTDYVTQTQQSNSFFAKTYFELNRKFTKDASVISRNIDLVSVEKKNGMIDFDKSLFGDYYATRINLYIVGELVGVELKKIADKKEYYLSIVQTEAGLKVDGDTSQKGNNFVFEDDVDKAIANRKLAGGMATAPQ